MKLKFLLVGCLISATSFNTFAAFDTVISKYYYKTSAKQELIGYWYMSCYLGFSTLWGKREGVSVNDPGLHGLDCTQLGQRGNSRGSCNTSSFDTYSKTKQVWDDAIQGYRIETYVDTEDSYRITEECKLANPFNESEPGGPNYPNMP
jgi:hypothetical protein